MASSILEVLQISLSRSGIMLHQVNRVKVFKLHTATVVAAQMGLMMSNNTPSMYLELLY